MINKRIAYLLAILALIVAGLMFVAKESLIDPFFEKLAREQVTKTSVSRGSAPTTSTSPSTPFSEAKSLSDCNIFVGEVEWEVLQSGDFSTMRVTLIQPEEGLCLDWIQYRDRQSGLKLDQFIVQFQDGTSVVTEPQDLDLRSLFDRSLVFISLVPTGSGNNSLRFYDIRSSELIQVFLGKVSVDIKRSALQMPQALMYPEVCYWHTESQSIEVVKDLLQPEDSVNYATPWIQLDGCDSGFRRVSIENHDTEHNVLVFVDDTGYWYIEVGELWYWAVGRNAAEIASVDQYFQIDAANRQLVPVDTFRSLLSVAHDALTDSAVTANQLYEVLAPVIGDNPVSGFIWEPVVDQNGSWLLDSVIITYEIDGVPQAQILFWTNGDLSLNSLSLQYSSEYFVTSDDGQSIAIETYEGLTYSLLYENGEIELLDITE